MAKKTADQIIEKYQRNVAGAGQDYLAGVQNPSRSWSQATAQGASRWAAGIQKAIQDNKFASGVSRAGDSKWQEGAINKGAQRYQAAAPQAAANYAKVAAKVVAAGQAAADAARRLPGDTIDQRIQRSAAAQRAVHDAWKTAGK